MNTASGFCLFHYHHLHPLSGAGWGPLLCAVPHSVAAVLTAADPPQRSAWGPWSRAFLVLFSGWHLLAWLVWDEAELTAQPCGFTPSWVGNRALGLWGIGAAQEGEAVWWTRALTILQCPRSGGRWWYGGSLACPLGSSGVFAPGQNLSPSL